MKATHPLKELEILLSSGVGFLDAQETQSACECFRDAAEILDEYFPRLGFDHSGLAPVELAEAERKIAARLQYAGKAG